MYCGIVNVIYKNLAIFFYVFLKGSIWRIERFACGSNEDNSKTINHKFDTYIFS